MHSSYCIVAADRFAASVNDRLAQGFYYSRNIPRRGSEFIGASVN
jgi:hypothetical protein